MASSSRQRSISSHRETDSREHAPGVGIVQIVNEEGRFGFIQPTRRLPQRFENKDVLFAFNEVREHRNLQKGDRVQFLLKSKHDKDFVAPSARSVWLQIGSLRRFGSAQSLNSDGQPPRRTQRSLSASRQGWRQSVPMARADSDWKRLPAFIWCRGTIVKQDRTLCIQPNDLTSHLNFDFKIVRGPKVNEQDAVRFKVDKEMNTVVVCKDRHEEDSDDSDQDTEDLVVNRFASPQKHPKVTRPNGNNEESVEHTVSLIGTTHFLGKITSVRGEFGYLKPVTNIPDCYEQRSYISFKTVYVKSAGMGLEKGDILRFSLSVKDNRPLPIHMSVHKFKPRPQHVVESIVMSILDNIRESNQIDLRNMNVTKSEYVLEVLSCLPLWQCLGDVKEVSDNYIIKLLMLVNLLHSEIKGMKGSFKDILQLLLDSRLFNPWYGPLKDFINKRVQENCNMSHRKLFHDFFSLVFRYVPEKSPCAVELVKQMVSTANQHCSQEMFLLHSLKSVSKFVGCNSTNLPWDDMPLAPTIDQLLSVPDLDYITLSPVTNTYRSAEEYLDTYFRLFHADCFDSLRRNIQSLLAGNLDQRDMKVYLEVQLAGVYTAQHGLNILLKFTPQREVKDWKTSSQLMFGNLLCISLNGNFKDVIWATVSNRDIDLLKKKNLIFIELCKFINSSEDARAIVMLAQGSSNIVMVESPTYYRSYYPVLRSLQEKIPNDFPFQEELIHGSSLEVDEPLYRKNSYMSHQVLESVAKLDPYQKRAWLHSLTRRVACIQGPPGTGKTFIGINIVKTLLTIKNDSSPILIMTYKNHALDEFLKEILPYAEDKLIRVGGRSNDESLLKYNLHNVLRDSSRSRIISKALAEMYGELDAAKINLNKALRKHRNAQAVSETTLLKTMTSDHLLSLLKGAPKLLHRCGVDDIKSFHRDLRQDNCDDNRMQLLYSVFEAWCPPVAVIKQIENKYKQRVNINNNAVSSTSPKQTDEEDTDADDLDAEEVEKERMSGIKQVKIDQKEVIYFSEGQFLVPKVTLFNTSNAFISSLPMVPLMNAKNIWELDNHDRLILLQCLIFQQRESYSENVTKRLHYYQELCERKNQLTDQHKIACLSAANIIGLTVTGASIHQNLLQSVKPSIVVVEEAAEILEAQLIATLGPWVKHLILIGDHKQLRPQVDSYTLVKKYKADISMMERLINNGTELATLNLQNRMRPEFAELLKDIYPKLESNLKKVSKNEALSCMEHSMFFWTHKDPETSERSFSNQLEAERTIKLALFMVQQGVHPDRITILAAYQGQVKLIRKLVGQSADKHREIFALHDHITSGDKTFAVHTIDMFQGDENDIVIVSLVRSNTKGQCGFLNQLNRRCVAQSRAKCGMYFIGNAITLSNSHHWNILINNMREQNLVDDQISLTCPKHPMMKMKAKTAEEIGLERSFCKLPCNMMLPCAKHRCRKTCKPQHPHKECTKPCMEEMPCLQHSCPKNCFPNHDHNFCVENVNYMRKSCGHFQEKRCSDKEEDLNCQKSIIITDPCGHAAKRPCYQKDSHFDCQKPCLKVLTCGHPCKRTCSEPCSTSECNFCEDIKKKQQEAKEKADARIKYETIKQLKLQLVKLEEESSDNVIIMEISDTEEMAAEYNKVKSFIEHAFPSPRDQDVTVEKISQISHTSAKKEWLTARTRVNGDPRNHEWKILKVSSEKVETIIKGKFQCDLVTSGSVGRAIYTSSNLYDISSDPKVKTGTIHKALIVDVIVGKSATFKPNVVSMRDYTMLGCDSVYNKTTMIANDYTGDEYIVPDNMSILFLYIVEYRLQAVKKQLKAIEKQAFDNNKIVLVKLEPEREYEAEDECQQELRLVESHFYRRISDEDQNVYKKEDATLGKLKIKSVLYYVNPNLIQKFMDEEQTMKRRYGNQKESKVIFAFHGTKRDYVKDIFKDNFDLKKLSATTGDKGFYGAGIYLSEYPQTALFYGECLILCKVLPGKQYDLSTKDYRLGAALQPGCDSHIVNAQGAGYGEELVIFNPDQILPCYEITYSKIE